MAEQWSLRFSAAFATLLGQFPIDHSTLGISISSPYGLYCILIATFHFICAQTVVLTQWETFQLTNSNLKLLPQLSLVSAASFICFNYIMLFKWYFVVTKYLKILKNISVYDQEFSTTVIKSLWEKIKSGLILFSWIFGLIFTLTAFRDVTKAGVRKPILREWSWLVGICQSITNANDSIYWASWLIAIHLSIVQNATGSSVQIFLSISHCIQDRIAVLREEIKTQVQRGLTIDTEVLRGQVIQLLRIFIELGKQSGPIILVFVIYSALLITVLTFLIRVWLGIALGDYYFGLSIIYYSLTIFQLVCVINAGDKLTKEMDSLQQVIFKLTPEIVEDSREFLHLKLLLKGMKFQFTGCEYFKLNRETLTSIVGTIVTYNVVFTQIEQGEPPDDPSAVHVPVVYNSSVQSC